MYKFKSKPEVSRACRDRHSHFSDRDLLLYLIQRIDHMSKQLDTLTSDVSANTSVVQSAVLLLSTIKSELDAAIAAQANGDDGAALADLSSKLEANTNALAQAVAANTPAVKVDPATLATPVHPSTDLPATPDAGSASSATEPDPRAPTNLAGGSTDGETPPVAAPIES